MCQYHQENVDMSECMFYIKLSMNACLLLNYTTSSFTSNRQDFSFVAIAFQLLIIS